MRRLCRLVPLLLVLASGCFDSHGADEDDAGTPRDGGSLDGSSPRDAAPIEIDAAVCRGALTATRATGACLPSGPGTVLPGVPSSIELRIDEGCFCGAELLCDARAGDDFVLDLSTAVCQAPVDCDACITPLLGQCALPPLAAGRWRVRVNGDDAFDLDVSSSEPGGAVQACWDFAEVVARDELDCPWPGSPFAAYGEVVCAPTSASEGEPIAVRVTDPCGGCDTQVGACDVRVVGNSIFVASTERHCTCDTCGVCPPSCDVIERECHIPPLAAGVYELSAQGAMGSLRISVGVPSPGPDEACLEAITP